MAICLPSLALAAELVVIESTSADYAAGEILGDEARIVLDESAEVTLIAEDGTIILLSGPYDGLPKNDETRDASAALDALGQLVGKAEADAGDIGGIRGIDANDEFLADDVEDHRTSPWLLHAGITGAQCFKADAQDNGYWREQSHSDELLQVKRLASGETVVIPWPAGDNMLSWPDSLPLNAGEMYLLRRGEELRSTNLLLHEIPATVGNDGAALVAFLAAEGCISQARIELDRLLRNP